MSKSFPNFHLLEESPLDSPHVNWEPFERVRELLGISQLLIPIKSVTYFSELV